METIAQNWIGFALRLVLAVVLFLVVGIVVGARLDWPGWYSMAFAVTIVFAIGWWVGRSRGGWVGPHFFYDLIRLARRSRTRDVRMLYGMALLLGLGLVYFFRFPHQHWQALLFAQGQAMTINDGARFAEIFVFTVIIVQNLAVLLLTPVYVGSALAEEKERRTLDLLFTTQMKDREIVFGKLCSRVVHLGAILLGGLPVLSLAQLWGGVDFQVLLANFINTAFNLLSVGSVSILVSALCSKVVNAVMIIYGFILPISFCLGMFSLAGRSSILGLAQSDIGHDPHTMLIVMFGLGAFHCMIAIACVSVALVVLRGQRYKEEFHPPPRDPTPKRRKPELRKVEVDEPRTTLMVARPYELPPVHNDPLFWKEMHLGMNSYVYSPLFYTGLGLSIAMLVFSFLAMNLSMNHRQPWIDSSHELAALSRVICILWALVCCVAVAYMASSTIVRERQQGTLDALLTLPIDRGEILSRKWLGTFFRGWGWWIIFATVVLASVGVTAISIPGGMLLAAAGFIHGAFFASLGLFLSVVSKTVLAAHGKIAMVLLFILFGTWIFAEVIATGGNDSMTLFFQVGLNPVRTWWALSFTWRDYWSRAALDNELGACLVGLALYGFLAVAFYVLAAWRFKRERNWRVE